MAICLLDNGRVKFTVILEEQTSSAALVYKAATLNAAEMALDELETKWGDKYPVVIKSWRNKWALLSVYFKYPDYVRTTIYTTNAVEAVHRQFRKLTKTKGGFANENSLLKLLYAGILKASERWTHPIPSKIGILRYHSSQSILRGA